MVADIVRTVADGQAEMIGLMGEGVDPHLYKPTRHDVKLLMSADCLMNSAFGSQGAKRN